MTDRLAELSAAGVAVWLDDLSRVRLTSGSLDKMRREQHVVGVTTNPSIFQKALSDADAYDAQLRDLAAQGVTVEEAVRLMTALRRALGVRRDAPGVRRVERRGRPGVHRGGPAQGARDREDRRRGEDAVVAGRPAEPLHQDPGDPGGPAGDHRDAGRGHQRQRHADLLAGALPGGDGRVPGRPGAGQGERPRPLQDRLGRVVLRLPGGHRGRQAARQDRHATRPRRSRARPRSPTPSWPTRRTPRSSAPTAGRRWPTPARTRSVRCGRPPRPRTRSSWTPSTSRS